MSGEVVGAQLPKTLQAMGRLAFTLVKWEVEEFEQRGVRIRLEFLNNCLGFYGLKFRDQLKSYFSVLVEE